MKDLGSRIKQERLALSMTQQQLADGIVTRNMLSQIESGTAQPSLTTLVKLAERLRLPVEYLLGDYEDRFAFRKFSVMSRLFSLFGEGKYAQCLQEAEEAFGDRNDDETAFLRCEAACGAARSELVSGALVPAGKHADEVVRWAGQTRHATLHLRACAALIRAISDNPQAPRLQLSEGEYLSLVAESADADLFRYLSDDTDYPYRQESLRRHMAARRKMADDRFEEALRDLEGLEAEKLSLGIGAWVLFRIYSDMEYCAKTLGDFEKAYRMASKRMSLYTFFRS